MSTPRLPDWLGALTLAACLGPVLAASHPSSAQRERIARDRLVIERGAQQAQQACARQFAVTDCVNRVKAERRERVRPLDQELALLDEALRKRRAAERLAQIQQRQAVLRDVPPETAVRARRPAAESATRAAAPAELVPREAPQPSDAVAVQADAQRRAAASARRAQQAQAHRVAVEEKNRQRATQRALVKPLPLPPAGGASR